MSIRSAFLLVVLAAACAPRPATQATAGTANPKSLLPEASVWGRPGNRPELRPPGTIDGHVEGDVLGEPIEGATVWILDRDGRILAETRSRAGGAFRIAVPEWGEVIAVSAEGWAFSALSLDVAWLDDTRIGMERSVRVEGTVTESDGTPIAGAEVWAFDFHRSGHYPQAVSRIVRAGEEGRFVIPDAPDGLVGVKARHPLFASGRTFGSAMAAGRVVSGLDVALFRRGTVSGTARDEDGNAIAGAAVAFLALAETRSNHPETDATAVTDSAGRFTLRVPPSSGWVVAATAALDGGVRRTIVEGDRVMADLRLRAFPRIRGRVLDARGKPAANAEVTRAHSWSVEQMDPEALALDAFRSFRNGGALTGTRTDAEGRFDFPLFDGPERDDGLIVLFAHPADGDSFTSAHVPPDEPAEIRLERRGAVRGFAVRDGRRARVDGRVEAIQTKAEGRRMMGVALEAGRFELLGCEAGRWELRTLATGFAPGPPRSVTVGDESLAGVMLEVGAPSSGMTTVRGRVTDKNGPIAGARISPGSYLHYSEAVRSRADGSFEIRLDAGSTQLFFFHPEHRSRLLDVLGVSDVGTIELELGTGRTQF